MLLDDGPQGHGGVGAEHVVGAVITLQHEGADDGGHGGEDAEPHEHAHEDLLAAGDVQFADEGHGDEAEDDVEDDLQRAEGDDVAVDDARLEALHRRLGAVLVLPVEDARVPEDAEGPALHELEYRLEHGRADDDAHDGDQEDAPALGVLEAQEQERH